MFVSHVKRHRALALLLGFALLTHLLSALGVYLLRPEAISTVPDPLDYRLAALSLLDHGMFSLAPPELGAYEMLRTPLYPTLLAATYLIDGRTGLAMVLLQSLMLTVAGALLYALVRSFRVSEKIALAATALYLFEPLQWLYTLHTMTETLTSLIVLALLVGALVGKGIHTCARAILFGLGIGLLVFTKPSALIWVPFLLLLVLLPEGTWIARLKRLLVAVLFATLTLLQWMARNHELTGAWAVSSSGPYNVIYFLGTPETVPETYYHTLADVSYNDRGNVVWYAYTTDAYGMLTATKDKLLAETSVTALVTRQLVCAPRVWFGFLTPQNQETYGHGYTLLADLALGPNESRNKVVGFLDTTFWSILLVLSVIGSVVLLVDSRLRWKYLPLLGMLGATIFVNLCAAWVRVLLPLYPVIAVAAAAGTFYLLERFQKAKTSKP